MSSPNSATRSERRAMHAVRTSSSCNGADCKHLRSRDATSPNRIERLPQQYFTALLARVSAAAALTESRLLILGGGILRLGRPSTSSTRSLRPRMSLPLTDTRRFADSPRCARRLRIATPRSTASSSTRTQRSRSCLGQRLRFASSRLYSRSAGRRSCSPTPSTPTTPLGPPLLRLALDMCRSTGTPAGRPTLPPRLVTMSPPSS